MRHTRLLPDVLFSRRCHQNQFDLFSRELSLSHTCSSLSLRAQKHPTWAGAKTDLMIKCEQDVGSFYWLIPVFRFDWLIVLFPAADIHHLIIYTSISHHTHARRHTHTLEVKAELCASLWLDICFSSWFPGSCFGLWPVHLHMTCKCHVCFIVVYLHSCDEGFTAGSEMFTQSRLNMHRSTYFSNVF